MSGTAQSHSLVLIIAVAVALVLLQTALGGARAIRFIVRVKTLALQGEMACE